MAKFKTRARTVDMLGRQQISGIPTAISELFKNSYDAYANIVQADYFPDDGLLVLRDNGVGMTNDDFLNRWLAIGTESKTGTGFGVDLPYKPENMPIRSMLGEKGIGRLAIAALGSQVLIMTRAKRPHKLHDTVIAFIHWGVFECPGLNLDDIDIPVYPFTKGTLPRQQDIETLVDLFGENLTKLEDKFPEVLKKNIENDLKQFKFDPVAIDESLTQEDQDEEDPFDEDEPKNLSEYEDTSESNKNKQKKQKQILTLTGENSGTHFFISPTNPSLDAVLEKNEDDKDQVPMLVKRLIGFTNTMHWKPKKKDEKEIGERWKPPIIARFRHHFAPETFEEIINPYGFFNLNDFEKADHLFDGTFDEYGNFYGKIKIYEQEPVERQILWNRNQENRKKTECGPFKLKFGYVQGKAHESTLSREDHAEITLKLNRLGGLYIYKDGIRVQPYGDTDYDFLEFEKRRSLSAGRYFFSYRRMFGFIELDSSDNENLREKAGREGFIENPAYRQFKSILVNFFVQIAGDFFRASGRDSGSFITRRNELKRQEEILKEHNEKANKERTELGRRLDEFFDAFEDNKIQSEVSAAVRNFETETAKLKLIKSKDQREERLFKAYVDSENALVQIEKELQEIPRPAVGLTSKLRRDWEHYLTETSRFKNEVISPAREKINSELRNLQDEESIGSNALKLRFAGLNGINEQMDDYAKLLSSFDASVKRAVTETTKFFKKRIDDYGIKAKADWEELIENSGDVLQPSLYGELISKIKSDLEPTITLLKEMKIIFEDLGNSIEKGRYPSILEAASVLEEENLRLREQYDEAIELSQLGMTISIISHEFDRNVRAIRIALRRFKSWADANPNMKELYQNLRNNFEHLEGYLNLFEPLQRRLYRSTTDIHGGEIAEYLREVFAEPLESHNIEIYSTPQFSNAVIRGYPSTFYPVFVNLVDNAVYWLKDYREPRVITLDAEDGGTFIVADNGPGISNRDREAIFEAHFTRKPGGRGLGLKISRDVLRKVDYDLILGNPTQGAEFRITPKQQQN